MAARHQPHESTSRRRLTIARAGTLGALLALALATVPYALSGREGPPHDRFAAKLGFIATPAESASPCTETRIEIVGNGMATQLGPVRTAQRHCLTHARTLTDGRFRFTSPGADAIHGTYAGRLLPTALPGNFRVDGEFTIAGGSRRFEGAKGAGSLRGDVVAGGGTLLLEGSICVELCD